MAVVYLGQNDLSKKINNIYIGIDNQSKQVIKGYVGINGYSKLFYKYKEEFYPTLRDIWDLGTQYPIASIIFNYEHIPIQYYPDIVDREEKGIIRREKQDYVVNASKIYLYGDCTKLFNSYWHGPICYDIIDYDDGQGSTWGPFNLEKYILFNYANNISHLFNSETSTTNLYNVTGNLANCNFINIINMAYAFYGCTGLTGSAQSGPKVLNMTYAYINCNNLTGSPACGPEVTNLRNTYYQCYNLKGPAVCGPSVTRFDYCYTRCHSLIGPSICGSSVINMRYTYANCFNLTGDVAIGEQVKDASYAYFWAGQYSEKGLKLNNLHVGKYSAINLNTCFGVAKVYGDIYILNVKSDINRIFYSADQMSKKINIHYPITETLVSLNTKLSSSLIRTTSSSEIHTIVEDTYIDIRSDTGDPYNIRIYNDYVES